MAKVAAEQLHVPPADDVVSVVVEPAHTDVAPPIADGGGYTTTGAVAVQPVAINV